MHATANALLLIFSEISKQKKRGYSPYQKFYDGYQPLHRFPFDKTQLDQVFSQYLLYQRRYCQMSKLVYDDETDDPDFQHR